MKMTRKRFQFYGQVQGVGFRYQASWSARALGLTGWVENEYDGSVLMEIQGDDLSIEHMIQTFKQDMYIDITDMSVKKIPLVEDERGFSVR
jgi:acylphosphatase